MYTVTNHVRALKTILLITNLYVCDTVRLANVVDWSQNIALIEVFTHNLFIKYEIEYFVISINTRKK